MSQAVERQGLVALAPGEAKEKDISWLDWSGLNDLSGDGKTVLFTESGSGGGAGYSVYIRRADGSPAVRIASGIAQTFSPDGKWVLAIVDWTASEPKLALLPTGPGEPRQLPTPGLHVQGADWSVDGKQVLFEAQEGSRGVRVYVMDAATGKYRALTPEGYRVRQRGASPDGKRAVLLGPDRRLYLYPLEGGEPAALEGMTVADRPVRWSSDGKTLYLNHAGDIPGRLYRLDVATGKTETVRTYMPSDAAGVGNVGGIRVNADLSGYAYSYSRVLSDLYVVDGLR
jgi:eukaryotic-like serine/threonine-protein kinase